MTRDATPPKNPAGEYAPEPNPDPVARAGFVGDLAALPSAVRGLVGGASDDFLHTKYVNWTVRQIVNHLADSHLNAFGRFKLALTEDAPAIKPYDEGAWAALADSTAGDLGPSLLLLDALHARWVRLLGSLSDAEFARTYRHPELGRAFTLGEALGLYAWHGRHHAAQVAWLKQR